MDISILLVNYNAGRLILQLVESIEKTTSGISYELIIIDNASSDDSRGYIKSLKNKKNLKLIFLSTNAGFAKANNIAASYAKGKYLLLLNPDTLFFENTLEQVLNFRLEIDKKCIIGIQLLNQDYTFQKSKQVFPNFYDYFVQAFFLDTIFKKSRIFDRVNYSWQSNNEIYRVDFIKGAFLFVDRDIYINLTGLDENFFVFSEDADFCYRAKQIGIECIYFPRASIIHYGGRSMQHDETKNTVELYKNILVFLSKHKGKIYSNIFRFILIIATFNRIILNFVLSIVSNDSKILYNKAMTYLHSFIWLTTGKYLNSNK